MKIVVALIVFLSLSQSAQAYKFGVSERRDPSVQILEAAQSLRAQTYRVLIDPNRQLADYDSTVNLIRQYGMQPQLTVGGLALGGEPQQIIDVAVAAYRRWPDSYSVSMFNEPELWQKFSWCDYQRWFRRGYRRLHALGARVLVGEFSPHNTRSSIRAIAACGKGSKRRLVADGVAIHPYDYKPELEGTMGRIKALDRALRSTRRWFGTRKRHTLRIYATEYGVLYNFGDNDKRTSWERAISVARRYRFKQLVAYQIFPQGPGQWNTSLINDEGVPNESYQTLRRSQQ